MLTIISNKKLSLIIFTIIMIVTGITFGTMMISLDTTRNYLQSKVYTNKDPVRDLALGSASPGVIGRLDGIITNVKNKVNAYSSITDANAFVDRYLQRVSTLEDAIMDDPSYADTYVYLFTYLYPRVYELKRTSLICNTKPTYLTNTNTTFIEGTPTTIAQQNWQNNNSSSPCYYICKSGYNGTTCTQNLSANETLVRSLYRDILKRNTDPADAEIAYWVGQMTPPSGLLTSSTIPLNMACAAQNNTGADGTNARVWLTANGKSCTQGNGEGQQLTMYPLHQWSCLQYDFPACTASNQGVHRTATMSTNGGVQTFDCVCGTRPDKYASATELLVIKTFNEIRGRLPRLSTYIGGFDELGDWMHKKDIGVYDANNFPLAIACQASEAGDVVKANAWIQANNRNCATLQTNYDAYNR